MYNELFAAWRREVTETQLGVLPPDFYIKIADYMRHIKEDDKPSDTKSVKVNLLEREAQNANRMLEELLWARYKKIIKLATKDKRTPYELLTREEAQMCENFVAFTGSYQKFTKSLLEGETSQIQPGSPVADKVEVKSEPSSTSTAPAVTKRLTLRFTKSIPAIMGADMKSYGPFAVEDVASLPELNAKILIKQGLAVLVEVS